MKKIKCPAVEVMKVIGGKWKIPILWCIGKHGTIRYNEMSRKVTGISNTMLTRCLDDLIDQNLIIRKDFATIPPKVEYSLSNKGKQLLPLLDQLTAWGKELNTKK